MCEGLSGSNSNATPQQATVISMEPKGFTVSVIVGRIYGYENPAKSTTIMPAVARTITRKMIVLAFISSVQPLSPASTMIQLTKNGGLSVGTADLGLAPPVGSLRC